VEMSFSVIRARIGETAAEADERRRFSRLPVELEARVRELGTEGVEARVLNISELGFMAETVAEPMPWSNGSPERKSAPSSPRRSRSTAFVKRCADWRSSSTARR
jgi:hypothetical protein